MSSTTASERPNILLVVVDQWRADCLGAAGHPVAQTPHLDRLAAGGVRFKRAYSAVPSCIAARAALLTGMHQNHHGRVGYQDRVPWEYPTTLAQLFADAGYHTQCVGKMHVHPERSLQGFHNVVLHNGYLHADRTDHEDTTRVDDYLFDLKSKHGLSADYLESGIGCNGYAVAPWPYAIEEHPTAWVTTKSIDFLRRRDPSKPFFLKVSYHRPHPPLDPPESYLNLYANAELPPLVEGDWKIGVQDEIGALDSPIPRDRAAIDLARRAYYAQLTFIDHQINRITHALHQYGVGGNTAILFCSDHGEMLYDHGVTGKRLPYEASSRVPMILSLPRTDTRARGRVLREPIVELRDILPTLCDIAGIDIPDSVDGRSLLPLCRGEGGSPRDWLHGEHVMGAESNHWITDARWKYVWFSQSGREQLFDLHADPTESHDLAPTGAHEQVLAQMRTHLVSDLTNREEGFVQNGVLVPGRTLKAVLSTAYAYAGAGA